uniref:LytR/AlgR family response regulator transcription factor n=1 Tax=Salmonella sp. M9-3 TaxID=3240318 RepID=UPI00352A70D4
LPYRRPNAPGKHPEPTTVAKPKRHLETFSVRIGARIVFVKADDIEWIEADGDYATLHSGGKTYLVRESLNRLSQKLNPNQFMRIHRST